VFVEIDLLVLGSFCVEGKESFCSWKKRKEEEEEEEEEESY
jgi:hypothetical protein